MALSKDAVYESAPSVHQTLNAFDVIVANAVFFRVTVTSPLPSVEEHV